VVALGSGAHREIAGSTADRRAIENILDAVGLSLEPGAPNNSGIDKQRAVTVRALLRNEDA